MSCKLKSIVVFSRIISDLLIVKRIPFTHNFRLPDFKLQVHLDLLAYLLSCILIGLMLFCIKCLGGLAVRKLDPLVKAI